MSHELTPITEVIQAFELCLSYLENEIATNGDFKNIYHGGFCSLFKRLNFSSIIMYHIFNIDGHYRNYLYKNRLYLFRPFDWDLRYKFLKKEIPYLKKLLKKGYTHI